MCDCDCTEFIEKQLFRTTVPPDEVAAIVVEPIQGEGGYIVPPASFLGKLRQIADRYGILLIFDEVVQCGMGRTGKMWPAEHFGVVPDILVTAKGIASGLPLSATVARAELMDWGPGAHASTFGGNPVACAAALETIRLLEEKYVANAARMGEYIMVRLAEWPHKHPMVGHVRGRGLMIGIERSRRSGRGRRDPGGQLDLELLEAKVGTASAKSTQATTSSTIWPGVQKMCASSCVKPRTRSRPCMVPGRS